MSGPSPCPSTRILKALYGPIPSQSPVRRRFRGIYPVRSSDVSITGSPDLLPPPYPSHLIPDWRDFVASSPDLLCVTGAPGEPGFGLLGGWASFAVNGFLVLLQFEPSLSSRNSVSEAIANKFIVLLSGSVRIRKHTTRPSADNLCSNSDFHVVHFPLARNRYTDQKANSTKTWESATCNEKNTPRKRNDVHFVFTIQQSPASFPFGGACEKIC
jgi:hypothetical protein